MSISVIATLLRDGISLAGKLGEVGVFPKIQQINYQEYLTNAKNPAAEYAAEFWKELQEDVVNKYQFPADQPQQQG